MIRAASRLLGVADRWRRQLAPAASGRQPRPPPAPSAARPACWPPRRGSPSSTARPRPGSPRRRPRRCWAGGRGWSLAGADRRSRAPGSMQDPRPGRLTRRHALRAPPRTGPPLSSCTSPTPTSPTRAAAPGGLRPRPRRSGLAGARPPVRHRRAWVRRAADYEHDGLAGPSRFAVDAAPRASSYAYGAPDELAARGFAAIVARVKPTIVHLHARTAAVSERLMDLAHAAGATVVFTYHTPTVSCVRGTMMLFGEELLRATGASRSAAAPSARWPPTARRARWPGWPPTCPARSSRLPAAGPRSAAAKSPALMADAERRALSFLGKADHIVAVCHWVREALLIATASRQPSGSTLFAPGASTLPARPHSAARHRWPCARADATAGCASPTSGGSTPPRRNPTLLAEALALAPWKVSYRGHRHLRCRPGRRLRPRPRHTGPAGSRRRPRG